MKDTFNTIASPAEGYYMERGSKFLAYVHPIESEEDFSVCLQSIKKDHPKARHFCTALRLFPDASLERSSDDGEPSGSAGKPILGQLLKHDLTNLCAVVVRYFGGTKLGIPGLIEAYKTSTANALSSAEIVQRRVMTKVRLSMSYEAFPHFLNYCKQNDIPVLEEAFTQEALMTIGLNKSTAQDDLFDRLKDFTQMDFGLLEDYAKHLSMEIDFMDEDVIC